MPADASQDAVMSEGTASGGPLTRRWFLTYVVAAPVLQEERPSKATAVSAGADRAPTRRGCFAPKSQRYQPRPSA